MSTNPETGTVDGRASSKNTEYFGSEGGPSKVLPSIFKLLELVCAVICIGLIDDPAHSSRSIRVFVTSRTVALAYSTFGTFLVIPVIYLFGKVIKENFPWKLASILNLTAMIMYIACAACILHDWSETKNRNYWPPNTQRMDFLCGAGAVSVVAAVFFLLDLIITVRLGNRGDLE